MLPVVQNYAMIPSVLPAERSVEVKIVALEKAFLFFEGEEYRITLIGTDADDSYYDVKTHEHLLVRAHGGVLSFSYTFRGEQEYLLLLEHGERKLAELHAYSLREDLYCLRPFKGDFHGHSYRSDGKRDPAALAGHYREQGYDFFSLTDHNRFYPGGEIDETYGEVSVGICRVRGEEVHCPGSVVHIVHVGGRESVCERYVHDRERYELEIEAYMQKVPDGIPEQYRSRYAKAMWATDEIHKVGGLAIFPHPYWKPGASRIHNVCDEFASLLLKSGMFDAYELVGGMGQIGNNRSLALWGEVRAEGVRIPVVGSSDVHAIEQSASFPDLFTVCFAERKDNDAIIDAVRKGNTVAVEATGDEYNRHYRAYGSLRLVSYAHFLLSHYFPHLQRIAQGEGVAMRTWAMGHGSKALIEEQVLQTESFCDQFFGTAEALLPDAPTQDFEARWRERHLQGPHTKGSAVDSETVTRQI